MNIICGALEKAACTSRGTGRQSLGSCPLTLGQKHHRYNPDHKEPEPQ